MIRVDYMGWAEKLQLNAKGWKAFGVQSGLRAHRFPNPRSWLASLSQQLWELSSAHAAPHTVAFCTDGRAHALPVLEGNTGDMNPACGLSSVTMRSLPVRPARALDPRCTSCFLPS